MKKSVYWHENMSFSQKDRLDRIQHTFLPTTEKNFIENERKMPILDVFFERQQLIIQPNIFGKIMKNGAFFVFTACSIVVVLEIIAFEI